MMLFLTCAVMACATSAGNETRKQEVVNYIQSLAKSDGGYGWEDQYDGHLTPTFAAIGVLYHLDALPDDRSRLAEYVKTHHPQRGPNKEAGPSGAEMRDLVYQQIQALTWLGAEASAFNDEVAAWKSQAGKLANYERGGNPVFMQEMMTLACRRLLGIPQDEEMKSYILERRRDNGSFNNVPAGDGGDGNILNTYWGVYALSLLGETGMEEQTVKWLQDCQVENGGFTHQPNPKIGVNDDVAYAWAAVKALKTLGAAPANKEACVDYLLSLQNPDGGFGNRPGWPSTPMASYYAIEALAELDALHRLDEGRKKRETVEEPVDFDGYKIFTVQFQAHGVGSPKEAVYMADRFGIDLWGAKSAMKEWLEEAQRIADEKQVKTLFFYADEDHDTELKVEGFGTFSHVLDLAFPPDAEVAYKMGEIDWETYQSKYLEPLLANNGFLMLQILNNEPLSRILIDESINRKGYSAISTIHFSQNFLFWLPHLNQYRYKLPLVALQDAHGPETWWWMHELAAYRNLFIAKEPTYEGLMQALKNNWIVAVRHDEVSGHKTRMLGGAPGVQDYIKAHENEWRWWNDETSEMAKPLAVVTILKPGDKFEAAAPESGVTVRIRTRWAGVRQNIKTPEVRLDRLEIDGVAATCEYKERKSRNATADAYYTYHMPSCAKGNHEAKAYVTEIATGKTETIVERFVCE